MVLVKALLVFMAWLLLPFMVRALLVELRVANLIDERWTSFLQVIINDSLLILAILIFFYFGTNIRNVPIAVIFKIGGVSLYLLSVLDVLIYISFVQRLNFSDILKYGGYAGYYVFDFEIERLVVAVFVPIALVIFAFLVLRRIEYAARSLSWSGKFGSLLTILLAFSLTTALTATANVEPRYVHHRVYQNFIGHNLMVYSEFKGYSRRLSSNIESPFISNCVSVTKTNGPVIIYMVESLSSYHSNLFGGHNNWTPNLDRIAENNLAFSSFSANGFTTEDGEIALLTTQLPLYPPKSYFGGGSTTFQGYWELEDSLPAIYRHNGYETYFLTTADLEFSSTGDWAESIGFKSVEGSKSPYYEGFPRSAFDAAPDEALVARILDLVQSKEGEKYFIFAKTATSHHPYFDPSTGMHSEKLTMRYVDEQIGELVRKLNGLSYFEGGRLVITGDHRAMTHIKEFEVVRFGYDNSFSRIPAVVVGDRNHNKPENISTGFSQVDISNALRGQVSGEICSDPVVGAAFGERVVPPKYILHRRGDRRNQVSIFKEDGTGVITLDGDDTWFAGIEFSEQEQANILQFVNYQRIVTESRHASRYTAQISKD